MIHCPDERARPTIHTTSVLYLATPSSAAGISGTLGNNNKCGNRPRKTRKRDLPSEFWRRRPDLNRGWRFCRFNGVVNRVVSCWSLVGPASFRYPVCGRYWPTSGLLPRVPPRRISPLLRRSFPERGRPGEDNGQRHRAAGLLRRRVNQQSLPVSGHRVDLVRRESPCLARKQGLRRCKPWACRSDRRLRRRSPSPR